MLGFTGENSLRQPLVDVRVGACCDGLQRTGVNRNQGAESTLAYLWVELLNCEAQQLLADVSTLRRLPVPDA